MKEKKDKDMLLDRWEIIPYSGVGSLRFGLSRSEARSLLEGTPSTFRQGPYAISDTDAYEELGLHLYYDSDDLLRCIMAFGAGPIHYESIMLLKRPLEEVVEDLARLGLSPRYDDEGYWFHDVGFVVYSPESTVEAVTVYRRGYYEEEIALASNS
jgi:hypothetical protein